MINIGIIGAGRIGQVHGKSILTGVPGARIKAVADPYLSAQARAWAEGVGIPSISLDHHDILNDPEIDAVLICSSTDTHAPISMEALNAGKHVFCEKPIDLSIDRINEVIRTVEKTGKKYQVGFNRRFDHNFRALREAVLAGKIGDVQQVKISSRDPEPPPIAYVKVSGGLFLDMMIHDIDMVRYLSGAEVTEVYAAGGVLVDPAIGEAGDVDTAILTLKLDNGALAVIDNSRKAAYGYDQRAEVFGNKGCAAITNDAPSNVCLSNADGVTGEKPYYFFLERYMKAYQSEIVSFVNAIEKDLPTETTARDGLASIRIGLAAKKSLAENRPVLLSEI